MTLFEKIIAREIPAYIMYEDDDVLAFLDISQTTKGHTLVVPKKVTASFLTVDPETLKTMITITQKLATQIVATYKAKGVNILCNTGEVAGQTVPHFHIHIIPRYTPDELKFVTQPQAFDLEAIQDEFLSAPK